MPMYKVRADGYFMGKFFAKGTELDLDPRQAKYAVMSGQLEDLQPKAKHSKPFDEEKKAARLLLPPKPDVATKKDKYGEYSRKGRIGSSYTGRVTRG